MIVAACPMTRETHQLEQLEQAGAAAAVMYSLFAEQVQRDALGHIGTQTDGPADITSPMPLDYVGGLDDYLKHIELAKKAVSMPIIASLNGSQVGEWIRFAGLMEQAGADALELNVYFVPVDPNVTGSQVEQQYFEIVAAVREQVNIPLCVKLGPFFSSMPNMAVSLQKLGIDGLVLFNRFLQPDIDISTFEVSPRLTLSGREALRLPLRWIAILRTHLTLSLASSSGAHCADDVIKLLLAGADVVSMASALLRNGPRYLTTVIDELSAWMEEKEFKSINEIRGLVRQRPGFNPAVFERSNYIQSIISYDDDAQR